MQCHGLRTTRKLFSHSGQRNRHSSLQLKLTGTIFNKPRGYTHYSFPSTLPSEQWNSYHEASLCFMSETTTIILYSLNFTFVAVHVDIFENCLLIKASEGFLGTIFKLIIRFIQFFFSEDSTFWLSWIITLFTLIHLWLYNIFLLGTVSSWNLHQNLFPTFITQPLFRLVSYMNTHSKT